MKKIPSLQPTHTQLLLWAQRVADWMIGVTDICRPPLGPDGKLEERTKLVLWQLTASCHSTSDSALLLIGKGRLWDADILVRSIVEGTLKFLFLTVGNETDRDQKFKEFDDDFAAFGQIKRHQRLEDLLAILEDAEADRWRPFREMLLKQEHLAELKLRYPKKLRQQIEQKWSFSEISASLKRSGIAGFDSLGNLLFNYGMSSHVAHQDIDGIGMVWDRNNRDIIRREGVELAHGARLVSDISVMSWMRAYALLSLAGLDTLLLEPFSESLSALHEETALAGELFHKIEYGNDKI